VKPTPRSSSSRRRRSIYSKGEVNRLIDSVIHPLFNLNQGFTVADAILHGFVERNPPETALKFIRYNLPKVIREMTKQLQHNRGR